MFLPVVLFAALAHAAPRSPYALHARQATNTTASPDLEVDVGYAIYRGHRNESANLNIWQGIRYGQNTGGKARWQAPKAPETNRTSVVEANAYGSQCPQAPLASSTYTATDNSKTSEDCLFLNIFAPSATSASNGTSGKGLPVFVWIHGGGYGNGAGAYDLTPLIVNNDNRMIGVEMNYRLGAFGFLSSAEVHSKGVANAGILDQQLALHWIQQYISKFGGDPDQVTLFGESAGAGSVMLHDIAYNGTLGTSLFKNSITSSPYLAFQYDYNDWQPSQAYYAFAAAAGCDVYNAYLHNGSKRIFDCLQDADSGVLKQANVNISQSGTWGTFAFLPVTDGILIQDRPSNQLADGRVNGLNHLAGHNALEGASWVIPNSIHTEADLLDYLHLTFPNFSSDNITTLLSHYPSPSTPIDPTAPLFATAGDSGPTTINQSTAATGHQQRAIAIYGETTFICPSYWLAEGYSAKVSASTPAGKSWKYQFSIPCAYHGADGAAYVGWPYGMYYSPDFILAFMRMLGNFIVSDSPLISNAYVNGISRNDTTPNPASSWPEYDIEDPVLMDYNTTCPSIKVVNGLPFCGGPGDVRNTFRLADAYSWEGGRGERCEFWKEVGALVPE